MPILVFYDPKTGGRGAAEFEQSHVVLGRGKEANIRIPHRAVSKRHALIERTARGYRIRDLESRNGIRVNRSRITQASLQSGDEFELGEIQVTFFDRSKKSGPDADFPVPVTRPGAKAVKFKKPKKATAAASGVKVETRSGTGLRSGNRPLPAGGAIIHTPRKSREDRVRDYRRRSRGLVAASVAILAVLSGILYLLVKYYPTPADRPATHQESPAGK